MYHNWRLQRGGGGEGGGSYEDEEGFTPFRLHWESATVANCSNQWKVQRWSGGGGGVGNALALGYFIDYDLS